MVRRVCSPGLLLLLYQFMIAEKPVAARRGSSAMCLPWASCMSFLWSFQSAVWHSASAEPLDALTQGSTHLFRDTPRRDIQCICWLRVSRIFHIWSCCSTCPDRAYSVGLAGASPKVWSRSLSGTIGVYNSTRGASRFGKPVSRTSCPILLWIPKWLLYSVQWMGLQRRKDASRELASLVYLGALEVGIYRRQHVHPRAGGINQNDGDGIDPRNGAPRSTRTMMIADSCCVSCRMKTCPPAS